MNYLYLLIGIILFAILTYLVLKAAKCIAEILNKYSFDEPDYHNNLNNNV